MPLSPITSLDAPGIDQGSYIRSGQLNVLFSYGPAIELV
jgi:hypothetical protein